MILPIIEKRFFHIKTALLAANAWSKNSLMVKLHWINNQYLSGGNSA